ncbi:MAG: hypothetical protein WCO44_06995 [Bacteroidota bacterium]
MKEIATPSFSRIFAVFATAVALLGIFVGVNYLLGERSLEISRKQGELHEAEQMTDTVGLTSKQLVNQDFEWGNPADTASHLADLGHRGKQSLRMRSWVPYSPGLWMKFRELKPGDSTWLRITGYVWFSCPPRDLKCSLVATCNRKGVNFKYMFMALEKENLKPNQWNRVTMDYRIPRAPDGEDVVQVYFWYRGKGEMLVDDIDIRLYRPGKDTKGGH